MSEKILSKIVSACVFIVVCIISGFLFKDWKATQEASKSIYEKAKQITSESHFNEIIPNYIGPMLVECTLSSDGVEGYSNYICVEKEDEQRVTRKDSKGRRRKVWSSSGRQLYKIVDTANIFETYEINSSNIKFMEGFEVITTEHHSADKRTTYYGVPNNVSGVLFCWADGKGNIDSATEFYTWCNIDGVFVSVENDFETMIMFWWFATFVLGAFISVIIGSIATNIMAKRLNIN